ncbi:hypothetical protein MUU72_29710 [Streptomyces sp. RS10V-4]|uniref:hypothetical protein n=1 Tax=Streptomyces rhizoryzae TaxID=2932493 RepID=UPI00200596E3|nr:hypothetical protein [Streptomyces rhizoryzae]MCK7627223.1 hypothetical protein [Streptomyces rhizoryzae]
MTSIGRGHRSRANAGEPASVGHGSVTRVKIPICTDKINKERTIGISLPVGHSVSAACNNLPGSDVYRL